MRNTSENITWLLEVHQPRKDVWQEWSKTITFYRKMMRRCIELRLPQNELIGMALLIPESISISSIQHYWMPCVMVGKNISQNIIWLEVLLDQEEFAAEINQKISLKENDGRPLKSSSTVGI